MLDAAWLCRRVLLPCNRACINPMCRAPTCSFGTVLFKSAARQCMRSPSLCAADGWCALALSGPINSCLPHAVPCCAARCGGA